MVDEANDDVSLNDHLLDVFVYAPAGFVLSALDDFPKLAALGRERLGAQVSTARVIGEFAVKVGRDELKRRVTTSCIVALVPTRPTRVQWVSTRCRLRRRPANR